ncbi:MAG: TlpA family protein disulfide reductase, partial [Flavisolibacter sp.]
SFKKILNDSISKLNQESIEFADTVSSPAAFIFAYNTIDFGHNYLKLKDFILRNAKRFPNHSIVQKLKHETLEYLKIFEEEFEPGNQIPDITLPDQNGNLFSTSSLGGKFYLINFWSSLCGECFNYFPPERHLKNYFSRDKFEIINIAIDSEKELWKNTIKSQKLNWPQLIDDQVWEGKAVHTYKIDSIPFNFLIGKDGRVLKKAIPADSLIYYIEKLIK